MNKNNQFVKIAYYASLKSPIHQANSVIKLLTLMIYIVKVLSVPYFNMAHFIWLIMLPLMVAIVADLKIGTLLKQVLFIEPFVIFAALSNVFFDHVPVTLYGLTLTRGWWFFIMIMIRALLLALAVLVFVSTTPINKLASALKRLHIPDAFILILVQTYRYIILMIETVSRVMTAYQLRRPHENGIHISAWGSMVGQLFLSAYHRAEQSYEAMKLRGFDGSYPLEDTAFFRLKPLGVMMAICVLLYLI